MPLTESQLFTIRNEVGDTPTTETLNETYAATGTVGGTIYSVLSRRLANMQANPTSFSIPGEYSQSTSANLEALRRQLRRWSRFAPDDVPPETDTELGVIKLAGTGARGTRRRTGAFDTERGQL